jgi:outer membrane protein TolC
MKSVLRNATVWAVALGVTVGQAHAQGPTPATPAQSQLPIDRYVVGQARPPELPGQTLKDISLEEAMAIALENNLELKVARMNPQSIDYQLQGVRASFTPTIAGNYNYNNSSRISENTLEGVTRVTTLGQNFNGSMTQNLQWFGSRYTINFQNSRSSNNIVTTSINPSYNTSLRFSFDMPILAGFKIDNTRNQLRTLSIQRQIEDLRLQTTIENTKASVRTAYWNLKAAIEAIEIQRRSLELAQRTLRDNQVRVEIGTLAPIETAQSETAVAQAEQQLLNAEIIWRNADLALKRLLAAGQDDPLFQNTINPTERVAFSEQTVDIPDAIKEALGTRLDIVQQRKQVDVTRLNLEVTKDVLKPNLAFNTGYTLAGTAGTRRISQGGVVTVLPAGYWDALSALTSLDTPAWSFGVNLTYPIGMRAAKANYARAALGLDQAEAQLKAQELTLSTEVTAAGLDVENTYKQVVAAQKAREAAVRNAEAQQTRFEVGLATNFEVVTAQQTLTSQRLAELRAILNYVNAIANFEKIRRVGR